MNVIRATFPERGYIKPILQTSACQTGPFYSFQQGYSPSEYTRQCSSSLESLSGCYYAAMLGSEWGASPDSFGIILVATVAVLNAKSVRHWQCWRKHINGALKAPGRWQHWKTSLNWMDWRKMPCTKSLLGNKVAI